MGRPPWTLIVVVMLMGSAVGHPAVAHSDGQANLAIVDFQATASSDRGDVLFTIDVVDADSGAPQPGYTARAMVRGARTGSAGSFQFGEMGTGRYALNLVLAPDEWSLLVRVDQGPSAPPAVPTGENFVIDLAEDGSMTVLQGVRPPTAEYPFAMFGLVGLIVAAVAILIRRRKLAPR